MLKLIKNIFKPYQGSSELFATLYQDAKDELALESWNHSRVIKALEHLATEMKTYGDARLIEELQHEFSLKIRTLGEVRSYE